MEKTKIQQKYLINNENGFELSAVPHDDGAEVYEIQNGRFAGRLIELGEQTSVTQIKDGEPYRVVLDGYSSKDEIRGTLVKLFDIDVASAIVDDFLNCYFFTKDNDSTLANVDMQFFSKFYDVLPAKIFTLKADAISLKEKAYQILEHKIDKRNKGAEEEEKKQIKKDARQELAELIKANLSKDDESQPED